MRLFVLAAGKGVRLKPFTNEIPKCLINLGNGITLLNNLVNAAYETDKIDELVVIAGHRINRVEEALNNLELNIKTRVLYNPFYETTSPLISLWVAHLWMEDKDFLVCNGDTFYSPEAIAEISQTKNGVSLGIEKTNIFDEDAMKVTIDEKNHIRKVGKKLQERTTNGVSSGLLAVQGSEFRWEFCRVLQEMVRERENVQSRIIWHSVINNLVLNGIPVIGLDLASTDWHEIDNIDDLNFMRNRIKKHGPIIITHY